MSNKNCNSAFDGRSKLRFIDNIAQYRGAAHSSGYSELLFNGNMTVMFEGNEASENGGGIWSYLNCSTFFNGSSKLLFIDNRAKFGGAMHSATYSNILFDGDTAVTCRANKIVNTKEQLILIRTVASNLMETKACHLRTMVLNLEGHVLSGTHSKVLFKGNTTVTFNGNEASENGGAVNCYVNCDIKFDEYSEVMFINNGTKFGGAVYYTRYSDILCNGDLVITVLVEQCTMM